MAEVPDAAVVAALEADQQWSRRAHPVLYVATGRDQVEAMLEAAAPAIAELAAHRERERAEAQLAEIREVVNTFLAVRGTSGGAGDLAEGIRQVLDRKSISEEETP